VAATRLPHAQVRGEAPPLQFEVASIKPNPSGDFRKALGPPPGGFSATNVTLRELIPMAFGIPASLSGISVLGGPSGLTASGSTSTRELASSVCRPIRSRRCFERC
jgi:hypothetical protein